jgi:hypothetical protein
MDGSSCALPKDVFLKAGRAYRERASTTDEDDDHDGNQDVASDRTHGYTLPPSLPVLPVLDRPGGGFGAVDIHVLVVLWGVWVPTCRGIHPLT